MELLFGHNDCSSFVTVSDANRNMHTYDIVLMVGCDSDVLLR